MKKSSSTLWLIVATLFAIGATILLLSYMVTDPGHVIIQLGGDCGKNYYTYLYHSLYDNGVWFDGMNYPYGEHIIYADGQPMLSSLLNHLKLFNVGQVLAIMNLAIGFSYVLAIVFTYKILSKFGVRPFISILFACLIVLLAPQVMRLRAHFALAYICPIPMLFYWTLLFHYTPKLKYPVYIFIMGFIMAFIHLYIGAIIFIWIAFYALGYLLIIRKPVRERIQHVIPLLVSAITLFVVIKICIALTDPVTDRPVFPLNTLETVTRMRDITTSPFSRFWQYAHDKKGYKDISDTGEGYTYIGLTTIIAVLLSLVAGIVLLVRKKPKEQLLISEAKFSAVWLFVAIGSLLLAMGAPFIWHMEWLLNYLSLFKQFRAMGRFSWVFYFIITIYGVVVINSFYEKFIIKLPVISYAIVLFALVIWGEDLIGYVLNARQFIAEGRPTCDQFFLKNEPVKWDQYLDEHHYKGSDFQGIILLPFFHTGSEKLWVGGDPSWIFSKGMSVAIEYHLPIVDVMMSRSSWSITEKQVKTVGGPFTEKPMLHDLKSKKPFLLLQFVADGIDPDQQYLYAASEYLGKHFDCYIYACYPERILADDKKYADSMNAIIPYMHAADTCIGAKGTWYVEHYDGQETDHIFGAGGAVPITKDDSVIKIIPVMPAWNNQPFELSAWFLVGTEDYRSPYINILSLDSAGNQIASCDAITKQSVDNYNMWFRASTYFNMKENTRFIKCILMNSPKPTYKAMDELLLRPADAIVISKSADGSVMVNNHRFRHIDK